jgi:hypothetical protein
MPKAVATFFPDFFKTAVLPRRRHDCPPNVGRPNDGGT